MEQIPEAYKEAVHHIEKPEKPKNEHVEQWNAKKKKKSKDFVLTRASFFVQKNQEI
jgi:hypothetical protein